MEALNKCSLAKEWPNNTGTSAGPKLAETPRPVLTFRSTEYGRLCSRAVE